MPAVALQDKSTAICDVGAAQCDNKKNIGTVRLNLFNHFVGFINSAFRNPIFRCESCKGSV